jgi:hypothetical protein
MKNPFRHSPTSEETTQVKSVQLNINTVGFGRVIATGHSVLRLRSHIGQSDEDLCLINLQLEGIGRYTQRDNEQINGPAGLFVVDTTEPFERLPGR